MTLQIQTGGILPCEDRSSDRYIVNQIESLLKIKTLHGDKPVTSDRFTHLALIAPLNFCRSDRRLAPRHIASHGLLTFRRMVALLGSANLSRHG